MKSVPDELSLRGFLRAVASPDEAHGTVSAAAIAGGLATSLLQMAAALPQTRSDSVDDRAKLLEAAALLSDVQEQLIETMETETAVRIFAARNMPQATAAQRTERQAAIQIALQASADVPLEVMRLCVRGLQHAQTVAAHASRAALPDVEMGIALLSAAVNGVRTNLEGKIGSLADPAYIMSVIDEVARLSEDLAGALRASEESLRTPPA